jgi:hypothetical protein
LSCFHIFLFIYALEYSLCCMKSNKTVCYI